MDFDKKVVIITGAGGGLGKSYALEFAKRGAYVVVNDLRGAEEVVEEIKSKYHVDALADQNNVVHGEKIVAAAMRKFGRVDILINNAGILRDVSFAKMTDEQFNLVIQVHVQGAYSITKAAWPIMKAQKSGRIVNVSSPAGLYGNFGQANYSAAKSALIGFSETLAKEGYKYNILVNAIAPTARSRMTESLLPPKLLQQILAEYITPLVVYLSHISTTETGKIFELAGGFFSQTRWERSSGELFYPDASFTPEAILNKIDSIRDFSKNKSFKPIEHPTQLANYIKLNDLAKLERKSPNPQGSTKVSLANKIVLITGAGAGLGKAHAMLLAKYGAIVVVNDIRDPSPVVDEIHAAGGKAYADIHDASKDADSMISEIVKKFGRIDAIINNAGILRDKSFANMTDDQWNSVMQVHLMGTYKLCKAVWPYFSEQKSGHIVNITSTSGIYGSFGQANYSSAKMGILGLSRTLAIEGAKKNIKVNIVAPHAETAMTMTIFKSVDYNRFPPELVSPLLVLLCSNQCPTNGELYEVGGGWCGVTRLQTAKGLIAKDKDATPEYLRDHWKSVVDFSQGSVSCSTIGEAVGHIFEQLGPAADDDEEEEEEEEEDDHEEEDRQLDSKGNEIFKYTIRDVILYNLGVGAHADELQYVYENDSDFGPVETFGTVIPQRIKTVLDFNTLLKNFNPMLLLHGEHYLRIGQIPIPAHATVATLLFPVLVTNKGKKAALVVQGSSSYDVSTGQEIFYNEMSLFNRGAQAIEEKEYKERPNFATINFQSPANKDPDFSVTIPTSTDQAAIYRLSGDYNPLHVDPEFAKGAKFPKPILHGLGYLGATVKAIRDHYKRPICEIKCRFVGSVFPGDKLLIECWNSGGDVVIFNTKVVTDGRTVIGNAALKFASNGKL